MRYSWIWCEVGMKCNGKGGVISKAQPRQFLNNSSAIHLGQSTCVVSLRYD